MGPTPPGNDDDDFDCTSEAELFDDDEEFDCHMSRDGNCGLAGTEECDWECSYGRTKQN